MPEWRNGRRTRLKIWHPFGYTGSTPVSGTKLIAVSRSDLRLFLYNRTSNNTIEYHLRLFFRFVTVFSAIQVNTGNRGTNGQKKEKHEDEWKIELKIGDRYSLSEKSWRQFLLPLSNKGWKNVSLDTQNLDEAVKYVREKLMPIVTDKRRALQKTRSAFLNCVYNMSEIISDSRYDS